MLHCLQVAVGGAFKAFDSDGNLTNESHQHMMNDLCREAWELTTGLANRTATCAIARAQREAKATGEYGFIVFPGTTE